MSLDLAALKRASLSRTCRWHHGGIHQWSEADWAVALAGEAGELCNAIKKLRRLQSRMATGKTDPQSFEEALAAIAAEAADTLIYLDLLCQRLGLDLAACTIAKFNLTSEQYGFPERLGAPDDADIQPGSPE